MAALLLPVVPVSGQVSIPATAIPVTVDFTGFLGTGFQPVPSPGQLDSDDWAVTGLSDGAMNFGDTKTTGDFARLATSGGVTTGGLYALTLSGNPALMVQPGSSDWNPGTITLRFINNTGSTLEELAISYDLLVLNNEDRSNSFNFLYSTDNLAYTAVPALNYTSVALRDIPASQVTVPQSTIITGLTIPSGAFVYLRWAGADVGGSGSRDEFSLDNISLTASAGASVSAFDFDASSISVSEGDDSVFLSVSISEEADCSVEVALSGGSASNGADFDFSGPALLSFSIGGPLSGSVGIDLLEDLALEGPETLSLILQNATGGCILGAVTLNTVTIADNDVAPVGACQNLYFSEYLEGSANNKALEIYNPTGAAVDLSAYSVKAFNNGAVSPTNTQPLAGILAAGDVYIIANSAADSLILAQADTTSTVTFFNGDDAIILFNGGDTIDAIGVVGVDPGTNWPIDTLGATSEFTLVRKPAVNAGQNNWSIGSTEWLVYAQNDFSFIGSHTQDPCPIVCSTEILPSGQAHTEQRTVFRLSWVPQPGAVGCQVEGQRLPTGPSPNKNIVSPPYNSLVVPKAQAGAGTTWTWRVRCACSIDPFEATDFTAFGDTFFVPVAREMASLQGISLFPNPANEQLQLTWTSAREAVVPVEVLDLMGRTVYATTAAAVEGRNVLNLPISALQPGMYFIRMDGANGGQFTVVR